MDELFFAEDWIFPGPDVIAHEGEIELAFVFADDRFRADDHGREERDETEKHHEHERGHGQFPLAVVAPHFRPIAAADYGHDWGGRSRSRIVAGGGGHERY